MIDHYGLFILLAIISEILGTISGFGSSILFVPIASMFFEFNEVLGITAVFHVFSNLSKIVLFRKGIDKNVVFKLGIPAIIFVVLGAWLTTIISFVYIEFFMSLILILLSVFLIYQSNKELAQSNRNLILGGMSSGFFAGFVGTGGAIRGIVLSAFQMPKDIFIATSALIDLGVDLSRSIVYISNGYFKKEFIVLIPILIGISILGSYLGKKLLNFTSEKVFRYLVLGIIIFSSILQMIRFLFKIYK